MRNLLVVLLTLTTTIVLIGCHKEDDMIKEPKVTEKSVEAHATSATFTWTVDYPGKIASAVEISLNEDMSEAMRFGSEDYTNDKIFTVTATGLKETTEYYYRYVVWNPNSHFDMKKKSFNTFFEGSVNGKFTINSSGSQAYFSQGNLQYQASTGNWRFAEHQYDCIGDSNSNISSSYIGWIDLFGWGTSGWNSGANNYQPWSTSTSNSDYYPGGSYSNNLTGSYAKADWGVYNAISNGGNQAGLWRTLTKDEWVYVFNTRSTSSGIRYAKACVNSQNGVILLPDDWISSYYSLNSTNSTDASFTSNTISASQWTTLEQHGAVFLPAAGIRIGTSVIYVGSYGFYWSASYYGESRAYSVRFDSSYLTPESWNARYYGRSVRLVRSAQ